MTQASVGTLMREWRTKRRRSQLDLSLDVGVSTRHLSFVETGRSKPSPELVLAVAEHLEVPLRERNRMLLAAGFAPRYSQRSLDDASMARVRTSLQKMLDAHDPYPGVVIDRQWNILLSNRAALALVADLPDHVTQPTVNVFRVCLHPDGLAPRTRNFDDWSDYLLRQIRRTIELTGDPGLEALEQEVLAYPNVVGRAPVTGTGESDDPPLLVPFRFAAGEAELSLFTTLTMFGTPRDVTLEELCVELFFPADDATERLLRA
jgi:transcriptional regulator with XRE-family HTH domain